MPRHLSCPCPVHAGKRVCERTRRSCAHKYPQSFPSWQPRSLADEAESTQQKLARSHDAGVASSWDDDGGAAASSAAPVSMMVDVDVDLPAGGGWDDDGEFPGESKL